MPPPKRKSTVITAHQRGIQASHYERLAGTAVCPVCGKVPAVRAYNWTKGVWVYKHTKRRGITETIYHESDK